MGSTPSSQGSGDLGGVLYSSGSLTIEQGLAQLALAYRIIDDRRGFLDFYAGARYNYLGVSVSLNIDKGGIQDLSENVTQRIASQARAGVQSAVSGEEQKLQVLNQETAILEQDVRDRVTRGLESDLETRLRQDLSGNNSLRDALSKAELIRLSRGARSELRALVNAVLDERDAEDRARAAALVQQDRARAEALAAQAKAKLRLVSLRPKRGSRKPSLRASRMPCQLPAPEMSGGSIRLSVFGRRLTSHAGCSWPRRGMWAVLGRARRSPGSFKRPSESISPATSSRSLAIATCMSTTRTAICSIK